MLGQEALAPGSGRRALAIIGTNSADDRRDEARSRHRSIGAVPSSDVGGGPDDGANAPWDEDAAMVGRKRTLVGTNES